MKIINFSLILVNYSNFDILKWFGQPRAVQKCNKNMIIFENHVFNKEITLELWTGAACMPMLGSWLLFCSRLLVLLVRINFLMFPSTVHGRKRIRHMFWVLHSERVPCAEIVPKKLTRMSERLSVRDIWPKSLIFMS